MVHWPCGTHRERQLKRKTDAWSFTKNISSAEMRKMVVKRKRRQHELERPTIFMRRHGDGEFREVPQERLDKFQRRFRARSISPISASSGLYSQLIAPVYDKADNR
jgi:hypothetical protein